MLLSQFVANVLVVLPDDPAVKEVTTEVCRSNGIQRDCYLNQIKPAEKQAKVMASVEEIKKKLRPRGS